MKVAIIGSRGLSVNNLDNYLPSDITEIISGGAKGVDSSAREYARKKGLKLVEFFPDYNKYGKSAPLKRNDLIANEADIVFAFWDGQSHGTKYVIDYCKNNNIKVKIFVRKNG